MTNQANGGQGNGSGNGGDNGGQGAGGDGQGQGNGGQQQQQQNGGGDGQGQQQQQQQNQPVQLTAEQWEAAYNSPRFKELNEKAKKADELQKAQDDAEAERLKQAGEHEKLADQYKAQAEQNATALKTERINNAVIVAASKLGAHDTATVTKLVDSGKITVADDGTISGVDDAVKALQTAQPYLFKTGSQANIGGGDTNSNGQQNDATYSLSQFQDSAFYKEHQKEMDAAMTAGKVDMTR